MDIIIIPDLGALTLTVVPDGPGDVEVAIRWRRAMKTLARQHGLRVTDYTLGRMDRRLSGGSASTTPESVT